MYCGVIPAQFPLVFTGRPSVGSRSMRSTSTLRRRPCRCDGTSILGRYFMRPPLSVQCPPVVHQPSRENPLDRLAVYVGQPEVAAAVVERETFVVQPEQTGRRSRPPGQRPTWAWPK